MKRKPIKSMVFNSFVTAVLHNSFKSENFTQQALDFKVNYNGHSYSPTKSIQKLAYLCIKVHPINNFHLLNNKNVTNFNFNEVPKRNKWK